MGWNNTNVSRDEVARTVEQVLVIAREYSADPGRQDRVIRRVEDLYDSAGMPD